MPTPYLNNTVLGAAYTDATTVVFPRARDAFAVQVTNGAVYYALAYVAPSGRDVVWLSDEHFHVPALLAFKDALGEGFPPGTRFGGIKVRSASATTPATVTVS